MTIKAVYVQQGADSSASSSAQSTFVGRRLHTTQTSESQSVPPTIYETVPVPYRSPPLNSI
jgi:hypothetical protein